MAVLTPADFLTKYNPYFADNFNREITPAKLREFMVDCKDSFAYAADIADVDASIEAFRTAVKTLTNKRIVLRDRKIATAAALNLDSDLYDTVTITALDQNIAINNPTGVPEENQELRFKIKDDGVVRNIAWGGKFVQLNIAPPAATNAGKLMIVDFVYNKTNDLWYCVNRRIEL